ncbi:butyrophilin subfamily 3 member A3-like isoform X2 [Dicentrarchus labrax]|uniref:butyrophilin subfamily 3 member A3-like isoform X2 n=1 Tax=Dicentrarchus labrax TaxID=13489 RepID=UPI0021F517A3|nr:butyrophilin subfamily 3 member A3-like isoform X2 [Dicentrarchus labrax]
MEFIPELNNSLRTTTVLSLLVFVLLPALCLEGQHGMVGPSHPIVAIAGGDIILPCHLESAMNASDKTVEWARPDLDPRFVYVWRDGVELEGKKHPSYKGRTSLFIDKLKLGDISLSLSKVKRSDEGTYKCFSPGLHESFIDLVVGAVSSPFIVSINRTRSGMVLDCESKGWYPEPEVVWLDGEGNLLSAGPTETVRGPDDLYTVSSRVTVEKRHSNNFTCRVQQKDINQTRETHIYVADDFMDSSSSSAPTIIGLFVGIMFILAVLFVVWKWRQNKSKMARRRVMKKNKTGGENNTDSLGVETGLLCQKEEETQQDKHKTNNILTQRKGSMEKQSDAGTGSQCVGDIGKQQHEVQKGEETIKDLDNREKEPKSMTEDIQNPNPAKRERHQDKSENNTINGGEETKSVNSETGPVQMDEEGQQPQLRTEGEASTDLGKEENKEQTQTTNNGPASEGSTDGGIQDKNPPAGGGTSNHLNKTEKEAETMSGKTEDPAVRHTPENTEDQIPPTNNKPAAQSLTEAETQQKDPTGGGTENRFNQSEGQTERSLKNGDTQCQGGGLLLENSDSEDGGVCTATTHQSPVDESTDQPQAERVQSDLPADQSPTEGERQRNEIPIESQKKAEKEVSVVSNEAHPPGTKNMEEHKQPQKNEDASNGEEISNIINTETAAQSQQTVGAGEEAKDKLDKVKPTNDEGEDQSENSEGSST